MITTLPITRQAFARRKTLMIEGKQKGQKGQKRQKGPFCLFCPFCPFCFPYKSSKNDLTKELSCVVLSSTGLPGTNNADEMHRHKQNDRQTQSQNEAQTQPQQSGRQGEATANIGEVEVFICRRATLQNRQQENPLSAHGRFSVKDRRISVNQFSADRMRGRDSNQQAIQKETFIQLDDSARIMSVAVLRQHVLVWPLSDQVCRERQALSIQFSHWLTHWLAHGRLKRRPALIHTRPSVRSVDQRS